MSSLFIIYNPVALYDTQCNIDEDGPLCIIQLTFITIANKKKEGDDGLDLSASVHHL